jgi:hypothetical protein
MLPRPFDLELREVSQSLRVRIEATPPSHELVEAPLSGVAEGWMPDIVPEARGLHERLVYALAAGDGSPDLRHLVRMRQAIAKIKRPRTDHLGLPTQAPKRARMGDPVAVSL